MDEARHGPPTKGELLRRTRKPSLALGENDKKPGHPFSRRVFLKGLAAAAAATLVGSDTPRHRDASTKGQAVISKPFQPSQQKENLPPVSTIIEQISKEASRRVDDDPESFFLSEINTRLRIETFLNWTALENNTHSMLIRQAKSLDTGDREEEERQFEIFWLNKQDNTIGHLYSEIRRGQLVDSMGTKYNMALTKEEVSEWYNGEGLGLFPRYYNLNLVPEDKQKDRKPVEISAEEINGLLVSIRQGSKNTSLIENNFPRES